ncbi:ATP-dependent DNA ligase [Micromonospora polyrhachis]|uniref:DNA ligase (ATP) n=1 Tax=Micromonospora polyrhachis TaxID=1282883 RepID=A0A7W7WPD9_9ACTN|nr:non-homologous end-joining DNA ligase [Micromonospora polyrhachis]MBB4958472.1 bifunctional non-homologous end joining protein LigD [Micromonospora polyrhachis]
MPRAPVKPMLASVGDLPAGSEWGYEFKWDGVRALADIGGATIRLYARSGAEITIAYPELAALREQVDDVLLDGEVVVLSGGGVPSFTALAERMHVREKGKAARLAAAMPVTYMIFDLLRWRGESLTGRPYRERRDLLDGLDLNGPNWAVPPVFSDGPATYEAAGEHGLEGVMAKRLDSAYRPGVRSPDWVKIKLEVTGDFVVGGWRPGARRIGGLLVGVPGPDGRLVYRGRVGGGIGAATERELLGILEPLRSETSPFRGKLPVTDARGAIWVRPETVIEVKYGQRTPDGRLRFPRLRRLRPDKAVEDVTDDS